MNPIPLHPAPDRSRRAASAAALCGALLAACGGGADGGGSIPERPAALAAAPAVTSVTPVAPAGTFSGMTYGNDRIVVRARGTNGARMSVYVNGVQAHEDGSDAMSVIVTDAPEPQYYTFRLAYLGGAGWEPLGTARVNPGDRVEVVFDNDHAEFVDGAWTNDTNLYVESIRIDGLMALAPTDPSVQVDWDRDGQDLQPGRNWLERNGALTFVAGPASLPGGSVTVWAASQGLARMRVTVDGEEMTPRGAPQPYDAVVGNDMRTGSAPYTFAINRPIPSGAAIDVAFINDDATYDGSSWGSDVNLYVDSIQVDGGAPILSTAPGVTVDWGTDWQARDGVETQPGQQMLAWNGALRVTAPQRGADPLPAIPIEQRRALGRLGMQLMRLPALAGGPFYTSLQLMSDSLSTAFGTVSEVRARCGSVTIDGSAVEPGLLSVDPRTITVTQPAGAPCLADTDRYLSWVMDRGSDITFSGTASLVRSGSIPLTGRVSAGVPFDVAQQATVTFTQARWSVAPGPMNYLVPMGGWDFGIDGTLALAARYAGAWTASPVGGRDWRDDNRVVYTPQGSPVVTDAATGLTATLVGGAGVQWRETATRHDSTGTDPWGEPLRFERALDGDLTFMVDGRTYVVRGRWQYGIEYVNTWSWNFEEYIVETADGIRVARVHAPFLDRLFVDVAGTTAAL